MRLTFIRCVYHRFSLMMLLPQVPQPKVVVGFRPLSMAPPRAVPPTWLTA